MNELKSKLKCKLCPQTFVFFEDLESHFFGHFPCHASFNRWKKRQDEKVKIFEEVVKERLTGKGINEIME